MVNSRQKGARAERELAKVLREKFGFMKARRGQQFSGANGDADVEGLPFIHIECKHVERLNIIEAMEQSRRDAKGGKIPIVAHKKNNKPWLITQDIDTWMMFYEAWLREQENEL